MAKDIEAWARNINQLRGSLGDTQDDEPQWKKTWRARELAREKSGISIEREQQLLDEHFAEMNFGEFRNEADKAAKVAKYRDLHDEKMERMKAASLEFLASVRR